MDKPTTRNKLEQGRAQQAFQDAKEGNGSEKYASYAKKLPMMIKSNGLAASLAFAFSKKKEKEWTQLYDHIEKWIKNDPKRIINLEGERGVLIQALVDAESRIYRLVTIEVLAYLSWLRRFAEGFKQEK